MFDTNVLSQLGSYYPSRFPSFWRNLDALVGAGKIVSVREVARELEGRGQPEWLADWIEQRRNIFLAPTPAETQFVAKILAVPRFQALVEGKAILRGTPAADPFVIAAAKVREGCVVTQEREKPNAVKIPNVCAYFAVSCVDLEGFMDDHGWTF